MLGRARPRFASPGAAVSLTPRQVSTDHGRQALWLLRDAKGLLQDFGVEGEQATEWGEGRNCTPWEQLAKAAWHWEARKLLQRMARQRASLFLWSAQKQLLLQVRRWRSDGWPFCPFCGEDELACIGTIFASPARIDYCYRCGNIAVVT